MLLPTGPEIVDGNSPMCEILTIGVLNSRYFGVLTLANRTSESVITIEHPTEQDWRDETTIVC
jgi:hypothetical protein